ncbi:unnamed protein product, partial [marine sediment metagenome]
MLILFPIILKAILINRILGIDHLSNYISRLPRKLIGLILSRFGAKIGKEVNISSAIIMDNAVTKDYSNLIIGNRCYIGKNVFFDLVEPIIIEEEAVISAKVTFLTHSDPGERILRKYYKRETGMIKIKTGAWIGACVTILPGVTVGKCSIIGANAL